MSFPHRTAFYDREKNEIISPNQAKRLDYDYIVENCGTACEYDDGPGYYVPSDKLIPLASSGLEDSEGQEIFEGHILCSKALGLKDYDTIDIVVHWSMGSWLVGPDPEEVHEDGVYGRWPLTAWNSHGEIIGHALTDPELVPDSFDIHDYFDIPTEE